MDISIVLSTYNRSQRLTKALESLAQQVTNGIDYEILIVDNNCTDDTKEVVHSFIERDSHFRYIFERRQGLSFGRNAGIAAARSDLIVFTDDDIQFAPSWIEKNYEASLQFPDAEYIGGRVLPLWSGPVPKWAPCSMDPFALSDLGDEPIIVSPYNSHCLVGASLCVRRRALEKAGLFNTATQRVKDSVGSTEDWDWEVQVWNYGGHGVYVPDVLCYAEVPEDRLKKPYHRRWHFGNGKFHGISGRRELQGSNHLCGVPLFVYRLALQTAWRALHDTCFRRERAFAHELRSCYYVGYIRQRWNQTLKARRAKIRLTIAAPDSDRADRAPALPQ